MKIKTNLILGISLALTFPLAASAATKIVIQGEPIAVVRSGNAYTLKDYKPTGIYNYVTIDGTKTVCYNTPPNELSTAPAPTVVNVNVNGTTVAWSCYKFDEQFFEVKP